MDPLNKVLNILNKKATKAAKKSDINAAHAYLDAIDIIKTHRPSKDVMKIRIK